MFLFRRKLLSPFFRYLCFYVRYIQRISMFCAVYNLINQFLFCFVDTFVLLVVSELIEQVKLRGVPACRPAIFSNEFETLDAIIQLMEQCWGDEESKRPTFHTIEDSIKRNLQSGK